MTGRDVRISVSRLFPEVVRRNRLVKFGVAICLVIALITAVGVLTYVQTMSELETNTQDDYTAMSKQGATELTAWQRERASALTVLATDSVFEDPESTDAIRGYLSAEIGSTAPDTVAFHYLHRVDDTVLTTTQRGVTEASLSAIPPVPAFDGPEAVVVSDPYERDGDQFVAFYTAVSESHALVLESEIGILVDNAITPTAGSVVSIADEDGSTRVTNRPEASAVAYGEALSADEQFGAATGFAASVDLLAASDEEYLVAYSPVHGTDLSYVLAVPESEAYALSAQISRNVILIIAIAVGGLGVIGVGIARPTVRELDRLGDRANELEAGNLDVDLDTDSVDEIGRLYEAFDGMRGSLRQRIEEAETQRAEARAARQQSDAVADRLETRAAAFGDRMEQAAAGDLTVRLAAEPDDPEALHAIAAGFNDALGELEQMVAAVDRFAEAVAAASEDVTDSVDAVAADGTRTSQSVAGIAAAADDQHSQLDGVAADMEEMSATIQEVAAAAEEASQTSRGAAERTDHGREATADAVGQLRAIDTRSRSAVETIERLESEMAEVGGIVETISSIAEQTNILALNATIEAARSEGDGDGFGVVADEVKALASETQASAAEIESLIGSLRQRTDESVAEMRAIREDVATGVDTVEDAEDTLESIAEQVGDADSGIREISAAMDTQATVVSNVSAAVDDLAAISRETTAEARQVVGTVDQQADTLDGAASQTHDLATQADRLTELTDDFTVSSAVGTETAIRRPADEPSMDEASADDTETRRAEDRTEETGEDGTETNASSPTQ